MKIQDVNNLSSEEFIENFNNIFEKTSSIAISSEKKRPFNNKNDMIEVFLNEFGTIRTGASLATFDADIDSGNVRVRATPTTDSSTVFKLTKTLTRV